MLHCLATLHATSIGHMTDTEWIIPLLRNATFWQLLLRSVCANLFANPKSSDEPNSILLFRDAEIVNK